MNNTLIVGLLSGGGFAFLAAIIAPLITKRLNRAVDAATSAKTLSETAVSLSHEMKGRMETAEKKCDQCIAALDKVKRREEKRDRALDAIHATLLEIVPLLHANPEATKMLRATIRTVKQARYEDAP